MILYCLLKGLKKFFLTFLPNVYAIGNFLKIRIIQTSQVAAQQITYEKFWCLQWSHDHHSKIVILFGKSVLMSHLTPFLHGKTQQDHHNVHIAF